MKGNLKHSFEVDQIFTQVSKRGRGPKCIWSTRRTDWDFPLEVPENIRGLQFLHLSFSSSFGMFFFISLCVWTYLFSKYTIHFWEFRNVWLTFLRKKLCRVEISTITVDCLVQNGRCQILFNVVSESEVESYRVALEFSFIITKS